VFLSAAHFRRQNPSVRVLTVFNTPQVGKLDAAKRDLATAAQLQPDDTDLQAMQQRVVETEGLSFAAAMNQLVSGDFAGAVPVLRKVIESAEDAGALAVAAHGYSYLGIALSQQGDVSDAITCHERHLRLAEGMANRAERLRALSNLSSVHQLRGNHMQAIDYHMQQAELITDDTPAEDMYAMYGNMGRAYLAAGQYEKALQQQERCLQIATDLDHDGMRAKALGNLGTCLLFLERHAEALAAHRKSLLLLQETDNEVECARQLEAIALVLQAQGDDKKALRSFDRALSLFEKNKAAMREVDYARESSRMRGQRALSMHAVGESDKAAEELGGLVAEAQEAGDMENEASLLVHLGKMHVDADDTHQAVDCYKRQLNLRRALAAGSPACPTAPAPPPPAAQAQNIAGGDVASGQRGHTRADTKQTMFASSASATIGPTIDSNSGGASAQDSMGVGEAKISGGRGGDPGQDDAVGAASSSSPSASRSRAVTGDRKEHTEGRQENSEGRHGAAVKQAVEASMSLAAALALAGRHREALFHYSAALRKAQQARDFLEQGAVLVRIGAVLLQDGKDTLAASAFRQALEMLQGNATDLAFSHLTPSTGPDLARSAREKLFTSLARALRGLQMIHVEHHQRLHTPGARREAEDGKGAQDWAENALDAAASLQDDGSSTTSPTVTAASSGSASALILKSSPDRRFQQ
jgi:tetratricopeptide (TPR) repeat protein